MVHSPRVSGPSQNDGEDPTLISLLHELSNVLTDASERLTLTRLGDREASSVVGSRDQLN
jgi:hypothetical protein